MYILQAYKFCPLCAGKLTNPKREYLECSGCGYRLYNNPKTCNCAIIENDKGEVLLVERKVDPKKGCWDLPGGFIDANEDLSQSVKRELKEELGVEVEVIKIIDGSFNDYSFQNVEFPTFGIGVVVKIISGEPKASDDAASFKYFAHKSVLKQKIAFKAVEDILKKYLELK